MKSKYRRSFCPVKAAAALPSFPELCEEGQLACLLLLATRRWMARKRCCVQAGGTVEWSQRLQAASRQQCDSTAKAAGSGGAHIGRRGRGRTATTTNGLQIVVDESQLVSLCSGARSKFLWCTKCLRKARSPAPANTDSLLLLLLLVESERECKCRRLICDLW